MRVSNVHHFSSCRVWRVFSLLSLSLQLHGFVLPPHLWKITPNQAQDPAQAQAEAKTGPLHMSVTTKEDPPSRNTVNSTTVSPANFQVEYHPMDKEVDNPVELFYVYYLKVLAS